MTTDSTQSITVTVTATATADEQQEQTDRPWLWNVVLLDDDDHSYDYVINLSRKLFAHPVERAFGIAQKVDSQGRAILLTTHKEHAELKVDQIHAFGRDRMISSCEGSMTAILEPAEFDAEDDFDDADPPA